MIHSTFVAGGFFLIADVILKARNSTSLRPKMPIFKKCNTNRKYIFIFAIAIAGLPPLVVFWENYDSKIFNKSYTKQL